MREVVQVARTPGSHLQGTWVREAAVTHGHVVQREREGVPMEFIVELVGVDAGDPLHHIKRAQIGVEAKVAAQREIVDARRVRGELMRGEVTGLGGSGTERRQRIGQALQVLPGRRGNDVEVARRPPVPVRRNCNTADEDVLDAALVKEPQQRFRIERVHPGVRPRRRRPRGWRNS
jgi:hypothetical protein